MKYACHYILVWNSGTVLHFISKCNKDMVKCILMKYREHVDIVKAILETTRSGASKTQIMYKAFLSYTLLVNYLQILQDKGLVKYNKKTLRYKLTKKGDQFIEYYKKIAELLDMDNNDVEISQLFRT